MSRAGTCTWKPKELKCTTVHPKLPAVDSNAVWGLQLFLSLVSRNACGGPALLQLARMPVICRSLYKILGMPS